MELPSDQQAQYCKSNLIYIDYLSGYCKSYENILTVDEANQFKRTFLNHQ